MHAKQVLYLHPSPSPFSMPLSGGHLDLRWVPSPDVNTLGGNKFLSNKLVPSLSPSMLSRTVVLDHGAEHAIAPYTEIGREPHTFRNHETVTLVKLSSAGQ